MSNAVQSLLQAASRLSAQEQRELAESLCAAIALHDDSTLPEWHRKILELQLATPDDDANTMPEGEVHSRIEKALLRARAS